MKILIVLTSTMLLAGLPPVFAQQGGVFVPNVSLPSNVDQYQIVRPDRPIDEFVGRRGGTVVEETQSTSVTTVPPASYVPPAPTAVETTGPVAAEGRARVVNGGIVVVDGAAFALDGLVGPAEDDTCVDLAGLAWKCGVEASRRLEKVIDDRKVRCVGQKTEESGEAALGTCYVGREDIGRILVLDGFASSDGRYAVEEHTAKTNGRGIWGIGTSAYSR